MPDARSSAVSNLLRDDAIFSLSATQSDVFHSWRRPRELLEQDPPATARCSAMLAHGNDLVQDITTDCSVVASLCAASARSERGYADVELGFFTHIKIEG